MRTNVRTLSAPPGSVEAGQPFHAMIPRLLGRARGQSRPISTLQQLAQQTYLVLLGDLGRGKSTFVVACLAGGHQEINIALVTRLLPDERGAEQDETQSWPQAPYCLCPLFCAIWPLLGCPTRRRSHRRTYVGLFIYP
jgi:hypothetical protein